MMETKGAVKTTPLIVKFIPLIGVVAVIVAGYFLFESSINKDKDQFASITTVDMIKTELMNDMPERIQEDLFAGNTESTISWAQSMVTKTLIKEGISFDNAKNAEIRETLEKNITTLIREGKIEFDENGNLTPLSKAYIVNETTKIIASECPEIADTAVANNGDYIMVGDYQGVSNNLDAMGQAINDSIKDTGYIVTDGSTSSGSPDTSTGDGNVSEEYIKKKLSKYYTAKDVDELIAAAKTSLLAEMVYPATDININDKKVGATGTATIDGSDLTTTITNIETKISQLTEDTNGKLATAKTDIDDLKTQIKDSDNSSDISSLNKKVEELTDKSTTTESGVTDANKVLDTLKDKDAAIEKDYKALDKSLSDLTSSFDTLKKNVGSMTDSSVKKDIDDVNKKISEVADSQKKAADSQGTTNTGTANDIKAIKDDYKEFKADYNTLKTDYNGTTQATNDAIADLSTKMAEYMEVSDTRLKTDVLQNIKIRIDNSGDYRWNQDDNGWYTQIQSSYFIKTNSLNIAYKNANYNINPTYDMDIEEGILTIRVGNPVDVDITAITVTHYVKDNTSSGNN